MRVHRRSVRNSVARRSRRWATRAVTLAVALGVALPLAATTTAPAQAAPADDGELNVLLFYKTNFHASHVQARQAVNDLAVELADQYDQTLNVEETDNAAVFNTANLETKDVVVFAQTGGVLFNADQRAALESYITGGGGFMGLHYTGWSVGQSEHDVNPFFLRLVGAMSEGHPENPGVRSGRVVNTDPSHPLTENLPADITRNDEWYDWTFNPAQNVRTLLQADESSYQSLGRQGSDHPITWCQQIDSGRSWYTGLGHEGSAYSEPFMLDQMRNGLAYSAGLLPADCSPPEKSEEGSWSGVTPWPLMPINMALTSDGKVQSFGSVGGWGNDTTPWDWTGDGSVTQGGQTEIDVWDPAVPRTAENVRDGLLANTTYTDLFCSMQVQNPHRKSTMTVGGDDSLGGNAPNDAAIGVTNYTTNTGLTDDAPMNYPRWYPTGTTLPSGDIVVQGGSMRGGPGGPGVLTPEIYRPDEGTGWKALTGATSSLAYGDGQNGQPDENRWWYPRAFVAPGSGTLFNISGTQMFELDTEANDGNGAIMDRGRLPENIRNQGSLGNPVGATSTAVMYEPGKILQVGGGWWANGGGPAGARAGFTVDITGGTANPAIAATEPMEYQRHWPTATMLPNGEVFVSGGSRENNGNGAYVTNAEIWNPESGEWTTVDVPYEHARLYHSTALLLPDGRVMIGGGGAPGPRNYTDVEYYSPSYLFDGNEEATRPVLSSVPKKIGYDGTFNVSADTDISRVTLVRNGSVTHGFNNDQNFQDLEFTQSGSSLTIQAPSDATYATPGSYMLFAFDENGTPAVAPILDIDPEVAMENVVPTVVDQFEFPKLPAEWRGANPPTTIDVATGGARMAPWSVKQDVQLIRGTGPNQGGLGLTGYQLAMGTDGSIERTLRGLEPGSDYRVSLKLARDSRTAGTAPATAQLTVGDLDATLTATTANPSQSSGANMTYGNYVGTFTADSRQETIAITSNGEAGLMIDDLAIFGAPGMPNAQVHYTFEEGTGTTAANSGTDKSVGDAQLTGTTGWSEDGILGGGVDMPGGSNANAVDLPDNLLQGEDDFTTSFWARPDAKGNWIGMFHIGDGTGDGAGASFFQLQMQTQASGNTGLAATFKGKGTTGQTSQERVYATPTQDVTANEWNHVAFTRSGAVGTLYLNGEQIAQRSDLTIDMSDIGSTSNNWLGRNGFPDPAYNGVMDEVRLYESALSASNIADLYADGLAVETETTVSADPASPSPHAEPVTFTATVEGEDGEPVEGDVQITVDGQLSDQTVEVVDGEATFPERVLSRGDHEVKVDFIAAEGWRNSTATTTHTVERPPPGEGTPIRYSLDEGTGTVAKNTGTDASVGDAQLQGNAGWTQDGKFGPALNLPGGASGTQNQVKLPNNIQAGMEEEFSVSIWTRPNALPNWVPLLQIGSSTDTFFLLQSSTQAAGATGFAATFKAAGNANQERLTLGAGNDLPLNEWTHVVFTMSGNTGRIYFDGELVGERTNFTLGMGDVGVNGNTTANLIGGTSWPDPRWNGMVDEFQMYDYELTEEQILELGEGPSDNAAPVATDDEFTTDQGQSLEVEAPGVLENDTDADEDSLTATNATQPANGEVELNADGSFTYTPDAGFAGEDTFTYTANDGTDDSAPATVTITVSESATVETELSATAARITYGKAGKVAVTIDPSGATGEVEVLKGTKSLGTADLSGGKATVTLAAKSLAAGTHRLSVQYAGDDSHEASTTTVNLVVAKVKPKMAVKATKKITKKQRAKVKVVLNAPNVAVKGKVAIKVAGGKVIRKAVKNGKVTVTLPKPKAKHIRAGKMKVKVAYLGNASTKKVVKTVTIRVKR